MADTSYYIFILLFLSIIVVMVDISSILGVAAVIAAILIAVFIENNHKYIDSKKDTLSPKLRDTIDAEISKYKKESNTRKRQVLNRVLALDSFRVALSDERQTLNKGLLYFGLSVVYFIILTYVAPYASLNTFLSNNPNPITIIYSLVVEGLLAPVMKTWSYFKVLWKINNVFDEYFKDEKSADLIGIVCKYFQPRYTKSKSAN